MPDMQRPPVPGLIDVYPLRFTQRALFGDVDSHHHLNNIAICRFFEEGRAQLRRLIFGAGESGGASPIRVVLACITLHYLREGRYPGDVTIYTGITRLGNSSFTLAQLAIQDQVPIANAESVMVKISDDGPVSLVEGEREAMAPLVMSRAHPSEI